jgi:O-antigen ligase
MAASRTRSGLSNHFMRTRYPVLFLCALIALLGSLTAAFATVEDRDFNLRGYENPLTTTELPFRVPRLGVNAELMQYEADQLSAQFELMRGAHIHWVRQFVRWDLIEPERGEYDWSKWDEILAELADYPELSLVAVFMNSPKWAREDLSHKSPSTPPRNPADFAAFVRAFAERYGNQVDYYQIWDEPNLTDAWGGRGSRPVEYAALLEVAYAAIHNADDQATVIAAALAPTTETGPLNISDWLYLRDLYALGAAEHMDAVAGKPYGFNDSPLDRRINLEVLNFSHIVGLREIMVEYADGRTALWASNWGWNNRSSIWGSVDEDTRVRYTLEALERAEREWAWLGGMILHHWQPDAPPDHPVWGFALIDANGAPTPLYNALAARTPHQTAFDGFYPAANPYARYSGVWTFTDSGADIGWLQDSRLLFDFYGRSIGLLLREDNYVGYLYPTIDGERDNVNRLPRDASGNPYIILTSGDLLPEYSVVAVADNLSLNRHTLEAVADRGYDRYALVGYAVSSGDLSQPYTTQLTAAWLAVIASAAAVLTTGWQIRWRELLKPMSGLAASLSGIGQLALGGVASVILMIGMLLTWGDSTPALFRRDSVQLGLSILTAGLIYLNPALPVTIIAALVLFILLYHRPAYGLALIIFYAPFFLFPVELYRFAFPMAELLTLITFAAWLLHMLHIWAKTRRFPEFNLRRMDVMAALFVGLGLMALFWSKERDLALTELRTLFIEPALFYLMFRTLPLTQRDVLRMVDALLLAGLVVCLVGIFLYLRGEAVITAEESARRLASVYGSPNNVALFLGRCIPFTLIFALVPLDQRRRIFGAVLCIVMLLTVMLTQSVGGLFMGVPAAIAAVLLFAYGRRAALPIVILAVIALIGFAVGANVSERFARALDFSQGTNFYRVRVWQSALNIIQDHPLTGLGLDQFLNAFRGYYIYPDAWEEPNLSHPHNILLDFWIRLGIGGVMWLIFAQVLFWRHHLHRLSEDKLTFALQVGVVGSMANLLAHGLIDNSIFVIDLAFIFMFLLAVTVFSVRESEQNTRSIDGNLN